MPDEHSVAATLVHAPDGSGTKLAAMVACHCGPLAEGETAVQPIKNFGSPVMDALGPILRIASSIACSTTVIRKAR